MVPHKVIVELTWPSRGLWQFMTQEAKDKRREAKRLRRMRQDALEKLPYGPASGVAEGSAGDLALQEDPPR